MAFDTLFRSGMALAKKLLGAGGLMATVTHEPMTGVNQYGEPTFGAAVTRTALVDESARAIRTATQTEVVARATITFLEAVTVTPQDRLTWPTGDTAPILAVEQGLLDDGGTGFVTRVYVG